MNSHKFAQNYSPMFSFLLIEISFKIIQVFFLLYLISSLLAAFAGSESNYGTLTFHGVDVMGERLAKEVATFSLDSRYHC